MVGLVLDELPQRRRVAEYAGQQNVEGVDDLVHRDGGVSDELLQPLEKLLPAVPHDAHPKRVLHTGRQRLHNVNHLVQHVQGVTAPSGHRRLVARFDGDVFVGATVGVAAATTGCVGTCCRVAVWSISSGSSSRAGWRSMSSGRS